MKSIIIYAIALITSIEFFYIFYLQTIITTSNKTRGVFKIKDEDIKNKTIQTLLKNQGIYNLLIAIFMLLAIFQKNTQLIINIFIYIILVAIYGAISSQKRILFMQGGSSIVGLLIWFLL